MVPDGGRHVLAPDARVTDRARTSLERVRWGQAQPLPSGAYVHVCEHWRRRARPQMARYSASERASRRGVSCDWG
jgi:hypothetical protein